MKKMLMIALFLVGGLAFAQEGVKVKGNTLTMREVPPVWPGCEGSIAAKKNCFNKNLANHLVRGFKFPKGHKRGTKVIVDMVVDKTGKAVLKKITGGSKELQAEIKRKIATIPKVKPGHMGGTPREIQYKLPFTF